MYAHTSRHRWADDGPAGPDPSDFLCACGASPTGGTASAPTYTPVSAGGDCTCDETPLSLVTGRPIRRAA